MGEEHLIFVGLSYEQVKRNYADAFFTILTDDEQADIRNLQMQRWIGVADSGKWVLQDEIRVPKKQAIKEGVEDGELQPV